MYKKLNLPHNFAIGLLASFTIIFPPHCFAAAYQLFTNIAYDNPAKLSSVEKFDGILGGTLLNPNIVFEGRNGPLVGSASSHENTIIPYGRFATRINSKLVFGVDITSYQFTSIEYPLNSILNTLSTGTNLKSYDISPRVSYQVTKALAIGVGFLADNLYYSTLNRIIPPHNLVNLGDDWTYAWTAGLSYAFPNKMTSLNLGYTSALFHNPLGPSTWDGLHSPNYTSAAPVPAVYTANITQNIKPWLFNGIIRYVCWGVNETLILKNTALGDFRFPSNYHASVIAQGIARYQLNDKWGIIGSSFYETNPQPTRFRSVGLPTYSLFSLGIGADYALSKSLTLKLLYGHTFSNPPIDTRGPLGPVQGEIDIDGNMIDLSLTYKV